MCVHSWQVAFGSDGSPSKALEGFCRKNAVAAADVTVEADGKGTEYVWAVVKQSGRAAAEARHLKPSRITARSPFAHIIGWYTGCTSRCHSST